MRKKAAEYKDQWKKRRELIVNDPKKQLTYEHYPSYPDKGNSHVKDFCSKVNKQLALYRGKKGMFAREYILESAEDMPAYQWWDQHGASMPELKAFATLVLAQPASASICERINSEFAFVKDKKRNRLKHDTANKLVGLFHNLRLLARMKKPDYSEPAIGWNTDENKSGITKYGIDNYSLK